MNAKLKYLDSPDSDDLSNYKPKDLENFCMLIQAHVGIAEQEGEEMFDFEVCTPQWLLSNYKKEDIIICRHILIVFEYNFQRIEERIRNIIESCSGSSWLEIAEKVGRWGRWEFEDYQDEESISNC